MRLFPTPARTIAKGRQRGFTLMELLVVMTIIALLSTVGIVGYRHSTKLSKESVLKENLFQIRHALEQYHADRSRYPTSLAQLRDKGYVREIPKDPMTNSAETWRTEMESADPDSPDAEAGIWNVRSGSQDISEDQVPYSDW